MFTDVFEGARSREEQCSTFRHGFPGGGEVLRCGTGGRRLREWGRQGDEQRIPFLPEPDDDQFPLQLRDLPREDHRREPCRLRLRGFGNLLTVPLRDEKRSREEEGEEKGDEEDKANGAGMLHGYVMGYSLLVVRFLASSV